MPGIDDLRQRVIDAEARFGLINEEHAKCSERLIDLMNAIEERIGEQQAIIDQQKSELGAHAAHAAHADRDNEQLREMLHSLLRAIEGGGGNTLIETMRTLDKAVSALIDGNAGPAQVDEPELAPEAESLADDEPAALADPAPAMEAPPVDEPVVEDEPIAEDEPVTEDAPIMEAPATEEPVAEDVPMAVDEPTAVAEPTMDKPAAEESVVDDTPIAEDEPAAMAEPAIEAPVADAPVAASEHPETVAAEAEGEDESSVSLADIMDRVSALVDETGALAEPGAQEPAPEVAIEAEAEAEAEAEETPVEQAATGG